MSSGVEVVVNNSKYQSLAVKWNYLCIRAEVDDEPWAAPAAACDVAAAAAQFQAEFPPNSPGALPTTCL